MDWTTTYQYSLTKSNHKRRSSKQLQALQDVGFGTCKETVGIYDRCRRKAVGTAHVSVEDISISIGNTIDI
jgi:hypothetical protein